MDRWLFSVFSRAAQRFFAASEVPLGSSRNPRGQEGGGISRKLAKGMEQFIFILFSYLLEKNKRSFLLQTGR